MYMNLQDCNQMQPMAMVLLAMLPKGDTDRPAAQAISDLAMARCRACELTDGCRLAIAKVLLLEWARPP